MKITRQQTWDMFNASWCPKCGEKTAMTMVGSFPGIGTYLCTKCNTYITINFLEDADDLLDVGDDLIIMTSPTGE